MRRTGTLLAVLLSATMLAACETTPKVQRIDTESVTDLSGKWNDTDSRLVSQEMIADVLSRPWIEEHRRTEGNKPTVIVGSIRNLSHEHINVQTFVADMERELINSGRVDFVASSTERTGVREERLDQDLNAREDTRNAMGQEIGADYMLTDQHEGQSQGLDRPEEDQERHPAIQLSAMRVHDRSHTGLSASTRS